MKSIIPIAIVSAVALALATAATPSDAETRRDTHDYSVTVQGTKGVRLRMLLITKSSSNNAPMRESKIITVPFETTFKAMSFYVWFDTLGEGISGKDGDRVMSSYKMDGALQGGGFGGTIRKNNQKSFGFGNL